jgi:cytochrome c-type biogenesis protein
MSADLVTGSLINLKINNGEEKMDFSIFLVLSAGMVAAFNPCGIIILPSYISYLIGGTEDGKPTGAVILKGLRLGGMMTAGFLTVFVLLGILVSLMGQGIAQTFPVLSLIIAVFITFLGLGMLFEKHLPLKTLSIQVNPGKSSVYLYGIAYAVTSLSCTLPAFLLVIAHSFNVFNQSDLSVVAVNFVVYSIGMGVVVTVITTVSLLSQQLILQFLKKHIQKIRKISAAIIVLSGIYLIYYWSFGSSGIF